MKFLVTQKIIYKNKSQMFFIKLIMNIMKYMMKFKTQIFMKKIILFQKILKFQIFLMLILNNSIYNYNINLIKKIYT